MGDGEGREGGGVGGREREREQRTHADVHTRRPSCALRRKKDARGDVLAGSARGHAWNPEQTIPSFLLPAPFPAVSVGLPLSLCLPASPLSLSFSFPPSSLLPPLLLRVPLARPTDRPTDRLPTYLSTCSLTPLRLLSLLFAHLHLLLLFLFLLPFFCSMPSKKPIYHRTFV